MTTVVGPWQGSSPRARIEIDYGVSYNADRTSAYISGTSILASDGSLSDSTNSWEVWGTLGSAGGSNTGYGHGSGGGRTGFCGIGGWVGPGGADVGGRVRNLEGPGATIEAVLHLDPGPLAPYTKGSPYYARDITAHSFTTGGIDADGNGGALVDIQAQVNTSQTDGGVIGQAGGWADIWIGGLARNTTHYFRVRVANNTYGWGPWGPWVAFVTLAEPPSSPPTNVDTITPISARVVVSPSADNGGATIDAYEAYVLSNNAFPGAGGNVVASYGAGTFTATGLLPYTQYYYTARSKNTSGYWSAWTPMKVFTTLPAVQVNVGGVQKNALPYICISPGVWKIAVPHKNVGNGVWKM